MRSLPALLLAFACAFAFNANAQGFATLPPGATGGGRVLWSAPFALPGCYASGQTAGASSAIAITRATTATVALTSDPSVLTTCASGEFRVGYDGLLVEPARTNYVLQSNTISTGTAATSPWTLSNATVSTVAGSGPAGAGTWAEVTSTTSAGLTYSSEITGLPAHTETVISAWMAKASGTGAATIYSYAAAYNTPTSCVCGRSDGGSCTTGSATDEFWATITNLGTTPIRLWVSCTHDSSTTGRIYLYPGEKGVSTGTTRFTGAQIEIGTYPTSLIVTTTTATARNLDAISATIPSVPSAGWCISGTWKPTSGVWPGALSLWTLGDTYNAANRASSWGNSSIYIVDAASGVKDLGDYTDPVAPWKIVTCNANGNLSLAVNGVLVDDSATGAGTGILTTPATTLHFGAQANGGTIGPWAIKNVKVWSAKNTKEASK